MKNKVIQQDWNNNFTQNNFTILLLFAKTVYQTKLISKTMARLLQKHDERQRNNDRT